jgi:hypothetical protein
MSPAPAQPEVKEGERTTEHWASYSQLTSHRACPQRWFYSSVKRLSKVDPEDVRVELEFGLWWHALRAADSLVRGRKHESLQWTPKTIRTVDGGPEISVKADAPRSAIFGAAIEWYDALTPRVQDVWKERLGWEDLHTGLRYVDEEWAKMWADDIEHERPLAFEMAWRRVLPSLPADKNGNVLDPDTVLVGYIDEVFQDVRRNLVVARDHKAHKSLSTQTTVDDMMDSQLQLYAWGAAPDVAKWGLGPIRATAYDRVCSVAPRPPQLTTSGKLATRLGEPTISASDLRTYLEWASGPDGNGLPWQGAMLPQTKAEKDAEAAAKEAGEPVPARRFKEGGIYQPEESIIERLSSPVARSIWFQRTRSPLNSNIVKSHLRAAVDTSVDMVNSRNRGEVSGEAARNLSSNCRWCDFAGLCRAQLIGGSDGEYDLADFRLEVRQ